MERYLPIGSVLELKNGKKVMVIGYYSVEYDNDIVVYDYSGCAYPEGMMLKSSYCSFNHSDIKKVEFIGYDAEEYQKMNKTLNIIDNGLELDEDNHDDLVEIEELEPTNNLESVNIDTLDIQVEEVKEEKFSIPHYEFDESGIIIKD